METLEGTVNNIIYHSGTFFILEFAVAELEGYNRRAFKAIKGNFFGLDTLRLGVPLKVKGSWTNSKKYGRQFNVRGWDTWAKDERSVKLFLSCVPDFDLLVAEHLVGHYGVNTFDALADHSKILDEVKGADESQLKLSLAAWDKTQAVRAFSDIMKDGGLTITDIDAAVYKFGMDAPMIVKKNPYRLMEIPGFNFGKVERLALSIGIDPQDPIRLEGAALWALNEGTRNGHLYLQRGDLSSLAMDIKEAVRPLPYTDEPDRGFRSALDSLQSRSAVVIKEGLGAYLPSMYDFEQESAKMLAKMLTPSSLELEFEPFLEEFERSSQLGLSETQKEAVRQVIQNRVLVLTGLPGTGKTTSVRALVKLFEVTRTHFSLMAPTGIAAKRLSHVTGHPASTIHRALKYDGVTWGHGPGNRYVTDAVIVDEVSMVDQELFFRLLSALREDTMLVLVGDDAQLPSVGPGNVLKELVACPDVPSVRLTQIYRQSEGGDIVSNSHLINRGELPVLGTPNSDSEFRFFRMSDEVKIREYIVKMAEKLKKKDSNFQVLAPKYDGIVGVDSLNLALRDVLNPSGPPEWQGKHQHFRVGDRLMVIKNDYMKGVYNGDVGKLIYTGGGRLVVRIYGVGNALDMEVTFAEAEADKNLRLAYAVTVHKSQGSEFDTIIMPVVNSQGRMLQRNLLYTAVTRAKQRVLLLGTESAIRRSIENNKVVKRNTVLSEAVSGVLKQTDVQRADPPTA